MKINIGETLSRRTKRMPNREALVETDSGRRFTYSELNARTNRLSKPFMRRLKSAQRWCR